MIIKIEFSINRNNTAKSRYPQHFKKENVPEDTFPIFIYISTPVNIKPLISQSKFSGLTVACPGYHYLHYYLFTY